MIFPLLQFFASKFLLLALHLEAGSFPRPLTAKEEIETFAALRAGDSTAREKLIRHNLRLVAHITKKYYAQPCDQDDLICPPYPVALCGNGAGRPHPLSPSGRGTQSGF